MVCFTQSTFKFSSTVKCNWFNAIIKYYSGIQTDIIVDGQKFSGNINKEFIDSLPNGNEYTIITAKFWSEHASIQTLPRYVRVQTDTIPSEKIRKIAECIDSMMRERTNMGGHEVYIETSLETNDFSDVIEAVKHLNSSNITRMYSDESFYLFVLNDRYTICVTKNKVTDSVMPAFDLDDGFVQNNDIIFREFNTKYFNKWKKIFDLTSGTNWDSPIIE